MHIMKWLNRIKLTVGYGKEDATFRRIIYASRSIHSEVEKFEKVSSNLIECIEKYKKEKQICISSYKNYKQEIKDCARTLFTDDILASLKKKDFKIIFTYSILLSKRVPLKKEVLKTVVLSYVQLLNAEEKKEGRREVTSQLSDVDTPLLLTIKYLIYLNVQHDKIIYNYIYSELNNLIEEYTLEELVETVNLISSFKDKKWINQKVFSRCINEIVKRSNQMEEDMSNYLVTIIKACSRLNCEIADIHMLLEMMRENYEKKEKKNLHTLIKVIYNLFLCNYHNYKNVNKLIDLLKYELMGVKKEEEYPTYKKYNYNNNIVLDTNSDLEGQASRNNSNAAICNDNISNIHEIYFNTKENLHTYAGPSAPIPSVSLYRLKFLDLLIRSDNFLYNSVYSPNSHFFDFVKQLRVEGKDPRETIFTKQATFFVKESGYKLARKLVHIYPITHLPEFQNVYVEFVHNRSINKNMKDNPHKFHRHHLTYRIRNLKFLGWNPILLYEHEWKKLRNYDEKLEYIKKAFKSIRSHTQGG
ncbi:Uncharacterized protein PCOAH_00043940 [Plasmodium coatneyi]|uniref:RAP domain-containing protein n=1 Tax=Plasmodium coatneyi TaxID=208452 RepID=A0A1B1E3M9_9APIC|nr:Uncharacterized protein PCOAH_00043940 [Plasmodium coatneyi]ANQ09567.1 Uncharacterized protein PCOAH_00043940 [Plasmodium coatneyi]